MICKKFYLVYLVTCSHTSETRMKQDEWRMCALPCTELGKSRSSAHQTWSLTSSSEYEARLRSFHLNLQSVPSICPPAGFKHLRVKQFPKSEQETTAPAQPQAAELRESLQSPCRVPLLHSKIPPASSPVTKIQFYV